MGIKCSKQTSTKLAIPSSPIQQTISAKIKLKSTPSKSDPPQLNQSNLTKARKLASDEDIRDFYEFAEILGEGKYGTVRQAHPLCNPSITFAVKSVPLSKIETWNAHELLAEELFCLQNLSHPNIVRFFEAFQDYKYIHIVTECLLGGDLLTHIERNNVFNEKIAAKLLKDVFSVVNFLHKKNICHRDIKAENLMFDETLESVKVIDFGLATLFKNEKERKFSFLVGSPFYIAPEILKGECTGMGCDVWSLGVLTYVILIGKPPFYEQETNKLWEEIINGKLDFIKEISNEAKDLIKEMMNKEKYERISIEKAVNHQWFEKNIEKKKDSIIFLEGIKGSIRKCCLYMLKRKKRKHKNKIHQIFENILMNFLKNTTWKIMEQLFYFIDYDKTGMINQIKIVEFLDKCGFDFNKNDKEIISNFILNENNSVEFYDFSCAIMEGDFKFNFDVFPQVLKHADIDECGGFSIKDFRYALKRRGYNMEEKEIISEYNEFYYLHQNNNCKNNSNNDLNHNNNVNLRIEFSKIIACFNEGKLPPPDNYSLIF